MVSLKEKRKSLEEETNRRKEELEKINLLVHDYEKQLPELSEKEKALSGLNKPAAKKNPKAPKKLRIGDSVIVLSMNLKGTVHTLPDSKGDLFV